MRFQPTFYTLQDIYTQTTLLMLLSSVGNAVRTLLSISLQVMRCVTGTIRCILSLFLQILPRVLSVALRLLCILLQRVPGIVYGILSLVLQTSSKCIQSQREPTTI